MPNRDHEQPRSCRASGQFEIVMPEPFDLSLTVAKPAGWHWSTQREVFRNGTLWSGTYLSNKPVGLKLSAVNENVTVSVYVESHLTNNEEATLQTAIKLGLGEDEDLTLSMDSPAMTRYSQSQCKTSTACALGGWMTCSVG
jgi:hypothetical protein